MDGPLILSETMEWYKKKHKKLFIFKVDFEKAYDSVNWEYLNFMLTTLGFGDIWCQWINMCLKSARTSILVNGSPTAEFELKRGLRQGDPLSPFLFLIVMEGLHLMLKNKIDSGVINGARVGYDNFLVSHLFYADDAVVIGDWNRQNLSNILQVFGSFYDQSGLKLNINKSHLFGLRVPEGEVDCFIRDSGCVKGVFPFQYLGLPLGSNMNLLASWEPLVARFKKRLSGWKANMLSFGGRLTLIKSVLGSLGIYFLSLFKCPELVLHELESLRARFFWGTTGDSKRIHWVKWDLVLASLEKGGLDIGSLRAFNLGLIFKWIWRFVKSTDSIWVNIIKSIHGKDAGIDGARLRNKGVWANIIKAFQKERGAGTIPSDTLSRKVGNGQATSFWNDEWSGTRKLSVKYRRLFYLDSNPNCLIADRRIEGRWNWNWIRPDLGSRNEQALESLMAEIGNLVLTGQEDTWGWKISVDNTFSVSSTRKFFDDQLLPAVVPSTMWFKHLPRKVNIFLWRLTLDRLPTRLKLSEKGLEINEIGCASCQHDIESVGHVIFQCSVATELWRRINIWLGLDRPMPLCYSWQEVISWLETRQGAAQEKVKLRTICAATTWILWRFQNSTMFEPKPMKKNVLFDLVCNYSFSWYCNRGRTSISRTSWLMNPM